MSGRNNKSFNESTTDDLIVPFERLTPHELKELKESLLNTVAAALIQQPRISVTDPTIKRITRLVKKIAYYDPEFILKLACYVRLDLNIRSTANYLLSVASNIKECSPFFKKYFGASIRLPSDWLDVAATYLVLPDKQLQGKALPTALRKSMLEKFPDFDAYQLGKYDKERTIKRKMKKLREEKAKNPEKFRKSTAPEKPMLTLKQMIRQLHISKPPSNVMCLLGKKYPQTETQFRDSNLPGKFDADRSGKRMKLPTPETWETLLSAKGNKASTWEELIEHKKLPFMAMLRNLRNMINTGVHPRYHKWAQNKLSNAGSVASSRQFPFQFFSAYEVIPKDLAHFKELISPDKGAKQKPAEPGKEQPIRRKKKPIVPAIMPTDKTFEDYRKAIDNAVKLATVHNVQPIRGATVVFCNVSSETREKSGSAKGMGSSVRNIQEIGYLLGLMCKYVCEDCDFRIYASPKGDNTHSHLGVELIEGTILDNMKVVAEKAQLLGDESIFPFDYIEDLIRTKRRIDNMLVLSHVAVNPMSDGQSQLANLLSKYRSEVNPDMLYVSVDLSGSGKSTISNDEKNPNDIMIAGFSDQILRFIAERGDTTQLQYVEHIDVAKALNKEKNVDTAWEISPWWKWLDVIGTEADITYPSIVLGPKWKAIRIFISSTFLDMHGERDVLTRIVFPELRERMKQRQIDIYEVDLRWGVTEEESQHGKSIQLCLDEVERCRPYFIGLLGDRYGWAPEVYEVPEHSRFDWLKEYPTGRSITELEMHLGALSNPSQATGAFFYLRHNAFLDLVPEEHHSSFKGNLTDSEKMDNLKERIRSSGLPVYDYEATWGGILDGKPLSTGLVKFAEQVFTDLWTKLDQEFPAVEAASDPVILERSHQQAFTQAMITNFCGRADMLDQMKRFVEGPRGKLMVITGKPGEGKSALLATFAKQMAEKDKRTFVLPHFISGSPGSTDIRKTLTRLCNELKAAFELQDEVPEDYKDLCFMFSSMLEQASFKGKLVVIIDAINQLEPNIHRSHNMEWLPTTLSCKFVISTMEGKCLESIKHRFGEHVTIFPMTPLNVKDRAEIVRTILWQYHKKLDERPMNNQMRVLLKKIDAATPLYLTVACEELRVHGVYEHISDRIKTLGDRIPKLFDEVLHRLEKDHSRALVQDVCAFISISRNGLLEKEIRNIVTVMDHHWNGFLRGLSAFLKPTGQGELTFFHQQFQVAVQKRYLNNPRTITKYHVRLAESLYDRADPMKDMTWPGSDDPRAIRELPHHLIRGERWTELLTVLSDLSFVELKIALGQVYDLISDYNEATAEGENSVPNYEGKNIILEYKAFVKANSHVLQKSPFLTFQQAANQPNHTAPSKSAMERWNSHIETRPWVKWVNKPQETDPCKMTYSGYQEGLTASAFSSDGKMIAAASRDCSIILYKAETGTEIATLTGHSSWIVDLKFTPDGRSLISASWDDTLKVWDLDMHHCLYTLKGHQRRVNSCAVSASGEWIASASWDCTIKLWESRGGQPECKMTISTGEKPVNSCTFTPDEKQVVSATWDGLIKIFDVETGKIVKTFSNEHKKSVATIAVSPSGKQVVSGGMDRDLILWDAHSGKPISTFTTHSKPITAVAYTSDGSNLLSASADYTTKVWDANLGQERKSIKVDEGYLLCCDFHPNDATKLATGSSDCCILIWDVLTGVQTLKMEGHTRPVLAIEYSPDGSKLASAAEDGIIIIWNADTGDKHHVIKAHKAATSGISWSPIPGDNRLVSASDDFSIRIWNTDTAREVCEPLLGHTSVVKDVVFDPKGKLVASVSRDNTLRIWDSRNGNQLHLLKGHLDWLNCVSFSANGNKVLTGSWDYCLKMWNLRKGEAVGIPMRGHESCISACAFSPNGATVVSSSFDGKLKIWDAETCTEITTLSGHSSRVNGFSYSRNGQYIASVSDDQTIKIWDPLAATEVATLIGHAGAIRAASFSSENKSIITAGDDRALKMWDVGLVKDLGYSSSNFSSLSFGSEPEEKEVEVKLTGHSGYINSVSVSADCTKIVSTSDDYSFSVWDIATSTRIVNKPHEQKEFCFKAAQFINEDRSILTAGDDGYVCIWDARTQKQTMQVAKHTGPCTSCSLGSDGFTVVSGGWDKKVLISDARKTLSSRTNTGHQDWILSVKLSSDGKTAISGGWDSTVRLWDLKAGKSAQTLIGHTQPVTYVDVSPDCRFSASASFDSSVKLWNMYSGKLEKTLAGHNGRVNAAVFGPKFDNVLVSCGVDHTVKVWDMSNYHLINEFICQSPATAVDLKRRSTNDDLVMVYGDSIGNIYLAKLLTNV